MERSSEARFSLVRAVRRGVGVVWAWVVGVVGCVGCGWVECGVRLSFHASILRCTRTRLTTTTTNTTVSLHQDSNQYWRAKPRRSLVQRDSIVLDFARTCQIQGSTGRDARKCPGCLASRVGFDARLCCCSGVRSVSARSARISRGTWRCPQRARCGRRPPFLLRVDGLG